MTLPPYMTGKRNGMKTSAIQRTPWGRKPKPVRPDNWTIAGVPWPASWIPEEPQTGFRRNRDDCFRWRVEDLLYAMGWKFWHLNEAKRSDPGFPDLVAFRERTIWLENKVRDRDGKKNGMSAAQKAFAATIALAGGEFYCITWPDDWSELVRVTGR